MGQHILLSFTKQADKLIWMRYMQLFAAEMERGERAHISAGGAGGRGVIQVHSL
jgi:hypothetical protein